MITKARYRERAKALATRNTEESKTDQSSAAQTDINVIMKRYFDFGTVTGVTKAPIYGDFSMLPDNLRGMIEYARRTATLRDELPEEFLGMTIQDLVALTPQAINDILVNSRTPAEPPTGEQK